MERNDTTDIKSKFRKENADLDAFVQISVAANTSKS
jgi:hypothetical protein